MLHRSTNRVILVEDPNLPVVGHMLPRRALRPVLGSRPHLPTSSHVGVLWPDISREWHMPTYAWILIWAAVIAGVALLAIRERRAGRRMVVDYEKARASSHGPANRGAAVGPPPQISQNGMGLGGF